MERLHFLDGVRGFMCLVVVVYHVLYTQVDFEGKKASANFWAGFVFNGRLAVELFWVTSGFSLACVTLPKSVATTLIARLPRLLIPVLAFVPVSLMVLGQFDPLLYIKEPAVLTLSILKSAGPSFRDDFLRAKFGQMWSLEAEIYGSVVVLGITLLRPYIDRPLLPLLLLCVWCYYVFPNILYMVTGVIVRELHLTVFAELKDSRTGVIAAIVALVAFFGMHGFLETINDLGGEWAPNRPRSGLLYDWARQLRCASLFSAIGCSTVVASVFESRLALFLGRNSYSAYIIHPTVIFFIEPYIKRLPVRLLVVPLTTFWLSEFCWRHLDAAAMGWSKRIAWRFTEPVVVPLLSIA